MCKQQASVAPLSFKRSLCPVTNVQPTISTSNSGFNFNQRVWKLSHHREVGVRLWSDHSHTTVCVCWQIGDYESLSSGSVKRQSGLACHFHRLIFRDAWITRLSAKQHFCERTINLFYQFPWHMRVPAPCHTWAPAHSCHSDTQEQFT